MDQLKHSSSSSSDSDEQIEDNLLEPLSVVSYSEREKAFDVSAQNTLTGEKDAASSLPDARAKVLHLQRVQRSGDSNSSSDTTVKSSSKKKRAKNATDKKETAGEEGGENEKEETVSFSLETIIRRGLTEQKLNTNFKNPFKFGKPDDNISLRVNPSANLFYEHSNSSYSDSSTGSYNYEDNATASSALVNDVTENSEENMQVVENVENMENVVPKKKRGRPKMTDEEKLERAAKRARNQSILQVQSANEQSADAVSTPVDELLAMGHSLFSEYAPKKRGRRRKNEYPNFYNETTTRENSKNYKYDSDISGQSKRSTDQQFATPVIVEKRKRGRRPKALQNYYVKLNVNEAQQQQTILATEQNTDVPIKKKRGRKPKSFYLQQQQQQQAEYLNATAPANLDRNADQSNQMNYTNYSTPQDRIILSITTGAPQNDSNVVVKKKPGRKPKAYYEQLQREQQQQQQQQQPNQPQETFSNNNSTINNDSVNNSYMETTQNDTTSEIPVKKKRGRKPKSYYLELQRQQELMGNQSTPILKTEPSSRSNNTNAIDVEDSLHVTRVHFLPTKRVPKPTTKQFNHTNELHLKKLQIQQKAYSQPNLQFPGGMVVKKKKGRKPKNYYQNNVSATVASTSFSDVPNSPSRMHTEQLSSSNAPSNFTPLESHNKMLQDRNKVLLDILEQRSNEIRTLKLRMSNLIMNDKHEDDIFENGSTTTNISWTNAELCKAFSLQRLSIPLFNYMREKFGIPLPKQDEIRKFVRNIQLVRGVQSTMLQILDNDGEIYKEHEKVTILQISYIKTVELFEYDENMDYIWGPHKFITIIVARGLYSDWNQLVYLNFDVQVSKQNLNCVIEALHKINYSVAGCVCNFEELKSDLWSEMEMSYGKNSFLHPITNEPIYAFYFIDDLLVATNKHFIDGRLTIDGQPVNKSPVMQAIQKNYRKIAIEKGLLEWADADCSNVNAIRTFFSQYTVNLLKISSPDDRTAKNTIEFINMIKLIADIMNRKKLIDSDVDTINFDTFLDFQNKKLDKVHARLFKLQCSNQIDASRMKFREATMMSIVSLKMLRKSVMAKYKYATFSPSAITTEFLKHKLSEISVKNNFERNLAPMQIFRILKEIFLDENCAIKLEPTEKFFYNGAVTAAAVNGRNETFYAMLLIQWLCDNYMNKHPNDCDLKVLKRALKKLEEAFCSIQNPNFRIFDGAVKKLTKQLASSIFGNSMQEIVRTYVLQRHLLRIKYFNENKMTAIPTPVHTTSTAHVPIITLEE